MRKHSKSVATEGQHRLWIKTLQEERSSPQIRLLTLLTGSLLFCNHSLKGGRNTQLTKVCYMAKGLPKLPSFRQLGPFLEGEAVPAGHYLSSSQQSSAEGSIQGLPASEEKKTSAVVYRPIKILFKQGAN